MLHTPWYEYKSLSEPRPNLAYADMLPIQFSISIYPLSKNKPEIWYTPSKPALRLGSNTPGNFLVLSAEDISTNG